MRPILSLCLASLLIVSTILSCDAISSLPESSVFDLETIPRGGSSTTSPTVEDTAEVFMEASSLPGLSQKSTESRTLNSSTSLAQKVIQLISRGGGFLPAGYNPFGYLITELGQQFLTFEGSFDSDIGRFLASVRERKSKKKIQSQWLEIVRASKQGQSMRIYRSLDELIKFCLQAGFLD